MAAAKVKVQKVKIVTLTMTEEEAAYQLQFNLAYGRYDTAAESPVTAALLAALR